MRELRFRQWTGKRFRFWGFNVNACAFSSPIDDIESNQYTGIKDKNGVEIYEGDILGSDNFSLPVKFHKYQGRWFASSGGSYILWAHKFKQFKVIGNIYTDKELLK